MTVKPATGSNPPKTLSLSKTATVGDLRKALGVDSAPRFVFMGKLLADDSKNAGVVRRRRRPHRVAGGGPRVFARSPRGDGGASDASTTCLHRARAEASGGVFVLRTLHRILSQHRPAPDRAQVPTTESGERRLPAPMFSITTARATCSLSAAGFVEKWRPRMTPSAHFPPPLLF